MPFSFNPDQDYTIKNTDSEPVSSSDTVFNHANIKDTDFLGSIILNTFILLVLVTGVLFGYRYYLNDSVTKKEAIVASYEKDLEGLNLEDVKDLSTRINVVKKIVEQFPFVTTAFMAVNKSVEHGVVYTSFNLTHDDKTGEYKLLLSGVALDYKTIIQQVDTLKRKPFSDNINSVEVISLAIDKDGYVTFSLSMNVSIKGVAPAPELFSEDTNTVQAQGAPEETALGDFDDLAEDWSQEDDVTDLVDETNQNP